jgi:deoxyribonuclease V
MRVHALHAWDLNTREARLLQSDLAASVKETWDERRITAVAGCDVHFPSKQVARAAVVVLSFPGLKVLEEVSGETACSFPYIPGLLSFRELPALLPLLGGLRRAPDLVLCDGQGIAHPRRLGLASHLGLFLGLPTVGCAKSRLVGKHRDPGRQKGAMAPLCDEAGGTLGTVLRTRDNTRPLFVSVGHLVTLRKSVEVVLRCCPRYRIPEPLRKAHVLASGARLHTST